MENLCIECGELIDPEQTFCDPRCEELWYSGFGAQFDLRGMASVEAERTRHAESL